MEPVRPVEANFTYHAPPGQEDEVGSLKVRRETPVERIGWHVASAWKPSDEELKLLQSGGNVELAVWQVPPPPVSLIVRGPACEECGQEAHWDDQLEAFVCTHIEADTTAGLGEDPEPPSPAGEAADGDPVPDRPGD